MNLTQLIDLEWNEEGKQSARRPEADRQGFRAVKYRAGGKTVFFEIGASFMPMFRRYLDLRAYILDGMQFPYLLVNVGPIGTLQQFNMNSSALLQGRLRRFDPHLPRLCPRQWRSAKQDWAISNHDPVTAAEIMQHTLDTTLKMYSNGTESVHQREFTDFLTRVDTVVMEDGEVFDDARVSSLGMCTRADLPKSISADPPIEPNCGTSEGCLFCDKYRVHADETDTRKLLSCRLCVRKTATLATSHEQFERMFGRVLQRIDFVLEQIRQREPALVARVENEVDSEGELDAYWSIKLERLMELGIA